MCYYNKNLPIVDEIVFITIKDFSDYGTYCNLIEYGGLEGFILNTELDKKVYDPKKQFNTSKTYPMCVLSISDGRVNLSYKKVYKEDRDVLLNKFYNICRIIKLCDEFAHITNVPKQEIYKLTTWKFYEDENHLDISKKLYNDLLEKPTEFVKYIKDVYPEESKLFIDNMVGRITYGNMEMSKIFKLRMFDSDSVKKLIDMLSYNDEITQILYLGSPKYVITTIGLTYESCKENIKKCIEYLKTEKNKYNCFLETFDNDIDDSEFSYKIVKPQEIILKSLNIL